METKVESFSASIDTLPAPLQPETFLVWCSLNGEK